MAKSEAIVEPIGACDSPADVYAKLADRPGACLLQSSMVDAQVGRYSILAAQPFARFTAHAGRESEFQLEDRTFRSLGNPFRALNRVLGDYHVEAPDGCPVPFVGGALGYFGYELSCASEDAGGEPRRLVVPDCVFLFYDHGIVFDHLTGENYLVGLPTSRIWQDKSSFHALLDRARRSTTPRAPLHIDIDAVLPAPYRAEVSPEAYREMVRAVRRYIMAGDVYQACTTYAMEMDCGGDAQTLYRVLRAANPAPFSALLDFGDFQVVSASPERFLRIGRDGKVEARPIKGTRPRGSTPELDASLRDDLADSEKDRAENLMIVDLLRNDLGRVCEAGSVRVPELFKIEAYATVFQLVSTIEGRLKAGESALSSIEACFPGGSMTGAPKIRAMEILRELEPTPRGIYSGALGYLSFDGSADLGIVIRTAVLQDGVAVFNVGGGIVYDSDPESEYQESLHKARALIAAISCCETDRVSFRPGD